MRLKKTENLLVVCAVSALWMCVQAGPEIHKRFEYKYSFKPPYLAQKDGSVPFFEYAGNAIASEESVRITPSLRSQKGMIWSREITTFDWWEVELTFRVTGRGRIGADGLGFWFTSAKGLEGPVYGSSDQWIGLGVFFDSFDNDNKHNNPYIMAMTNDGTKNFDHQNDGSTQQLAGCLRDFRNKPFPVKAKIEYYQNTLTVLFHNGMSNNDKDYEMCVRSENVVLPKNGFFGVSAATGGLADDHDVLKFVTHSLRSPEMALVPDGLDAEETQKFNKEFDAYQEKLKEQKATWAKDHPDEAKKNEDYDSMDGFFEDDSTRELKQIFQGQSAMNEVIRDLHRKMDEIIGRQERSLSQLTAIQNSGGAVAAGGAKPSGGGAPVDTIRRDEVNAVLANQREMVSAARDIKNFVTDIHGKVGTIQQTQNRQPTATVQQVGGQGLPADLQNSIQEMKDGINTVKRDLSNTAARIEKTKCPDVSSSGCVSSTLFIVLMGVQLVVLIAYMMYRDSKEAQAKKFY